MPGAPNTTPFDVVEMDVSFIILIALLALIILLLLEVPVAFSLAGSGTLGLVLLRGPSVAGAALGSIPFQASSSFTLIVVPMFILMGIFAMHGSIADDLFRLTHRMTRGLRGGVAVATVVTCAGFSAVCGSSVATAATVGRLTIGEMIRYGYTPAFAAAIVASAGTLGVLIPPSIALVLFGVITNESIGKLLIAGIIPGIVSAIIMGAGILVCARLGIGFDRNAPEATEPEETVDNRSYGGVFKLLLLFVIIVGGIYSGIITATEAAAIGAFAALLIMLASAIVNKTSVTSRLFASLRDSASITSMVFAIIVGAGIFSYFIVSAGVPNAFANWVLGFDLPPRLLVLLLLLSLIPLGMFLDGVSILLITAPLFYPVVVTELGYDGLWYAVLTVKMIELGLITPPVGVNVFIVANMAKGANLENVFRNITTFIVLDLIIFAILFTFPVLVTWLPQSVR